MGTLPTAVWHAWVLFSFWRLRLVQLLSSHAPLSRPACPWRLRTEPFLLVRFDAMYQSGKVVGVSSSVCWEFSLPLEEFP